MATMTRQRTPLLIVFLDLTRFAAQSQRTDDSEIADTLDAYYERVAKGVEGAGGTIVKFIGDAALAVFPEDGADAGVRMLLDLKPVVDHFMAERGWDCRLIAKVHFGDVIAGQFGPQGNKRFDVVGRAVNTAAVLETAGVTLSVEAFRQLSGEMRQHFKKHTPPITYIRADDPRPAARRGR